MQTKVIVVSEQDQVVRIYVGLPEAKQMDQTGQFRVAGPTEPTALADMAIDLANHFGWLNGTPEVPAAAKAEPKPKAVAPAPAKALTAAQLAEREPVRCSVCKKAMVRGSMERHLRSVHKWETSKARAAQRIAVVDEQARTEIRPAPTTKTARKASPNDKWKQFVACPVDDCETVMTRSNMTRHLMRDLPNHGMRHGEASEYVRNLPTTNRKPAKGKPQPQRANRQGLAGARILEQEIFPAVLDWMRNQSEPVTSRHIADQFQTNTGTALAWMTKLIASGQVADVTQPPYVQGQPRSFALVPETIGRTQEPAELVAGNGYLHGVGVGGSIAST